MRRRKTTVLVGSSPLTRGKPVSVPANEPVGGLIPAHAGKTRPGWRAGGHQGAHPRSRGENLPASWSMLVPPGSSPLTRGKRSPLYPAGHARGLIPAHAGKTSSACGAVWSARAHPRSRGENADASRARPTGHRLIPAHAGKTGMNGSTTTATRAHPRSRGENPAHRMMGVRRAGSSPLTRGKPYRPRRASASTGLIPAHAGKTVLELVGEVHGRAHPRSRGENEDLHLMRECVAGSSPLTRGKLLHGGG